MSQASFMEEVDMAQDEMFSGPVSESVPSSTTGFMHRGRERADSTVSSTSFAYYDEEDEGMDTDSWREEEAIIDDDEDEEEEEEGTDEHGQVYEEEEIAENGHEEGFGQSNGKSTDLEAGQGRRPSRRRKSSGLSRMSGVSRTSLSSARDPLLKRNDSYGSNTSNISGRGFRDRVSQKLYIQSEDLTIVIAGFKTSIIGYAVYITLCIVTGGLAYLLFRWLPSWRVRLIGTATALRSCAWVVIEVST